MVKKFLILAMGLTFFLTQVSAQYGSMSRDDVKELVNAARQLAGKFDNDFDKALERSVVDGTKFEENYNERADDLEDHLDNAENEVGDPDDFREHLDSAMQAAFDVNKMMSSNRFPESLNRDWDIIRGKLNALAAIAGLKPLSR